MKVSTSRLTLMFFSAFALCMAGALVLPPVAHAVPTLTVSDGTTTVSGTEVIPGMVTYAGTLGVWTITIDTGITMPAEGSSSLPYMHLNTVDTSKGAAGDLTIIFSATDFGPTTYPKTNLHVGGTVDSNTGNSMSIAYYYDPTNVAYTLGSTTAVQIASLGPFGPGAFGQNTSGLLSTTSPFSLSEVVTLHHAANLFGQTSSVDADLSPVPEPSTLFLLGTGLLGLGFLVRQRKV